MKGTRRPDRVVLNVTIPREAREILAREVGVGGHTQGEVVARLLFEHQARTEECERLANLRPQHA